MRNNWPADLCLVSNGASGWSLPYEDGTMVQSSYCRMARFYLRRLGCPSSSSMLRLQQILHIRFLSERQHEIREFVDWPLRWSKKKKIAYRSSALGCGIVWSTKAVTVCRTWCPVLRGILPFSAIRTWSTVDKSHSNKQSYRLSPNLNDQNIRCRHGEAVEHEPFPNVRIENEMHIMIVGFYISRNEVWPQQHFFPTSQLCLNLQMNGHNHNAHKVFCTTTIMKHLQFWDVVQK